MLIKNYVLLCGVLLLSLSIKTQADETEKIKDETLQVVNYFQIRNFKLEKIPAVKFAPPTNCYSGFVDEDKTNIQLSLNADSVERKVTLAHELTHVYRSQFNKSEELWLDEGLAKFIEYQYSSVWPVSYDDLLAKDSYLNLGNTSLKGLNNFSCKGDGYRASFYFVLYLYNHFGGEVLLRKLLTSSKSGWDNILTAIQETAAQRIISIEPQWLSKESIVRHFAVAIWENNPYLAKYSLFSLDTKFIGLRNTNVALPAKLNPPPANEIRIFYSKKFIANHNAKEIISIFDDKDTLIRHASPQDQPTVFVYLYY